MSNKTEKTVSVTENPKAVVDEKAVAESNPVVDPGEEYVEMFIPKDMRIQGDDTIHLSVNGEECHIKPGNTVKIKRKFAEVYQNSMRSDMAAKAYTDKIAENFQM